MLTVGIHSEIQLPEVLSRAAEAINKGAEFSTAIVNHNPVTFGVILERHLQLYRTYIQERRVEGERTITRPLLEWVPTPPEKLGSLMTGRLVYVHGSAVETGWPASDIALELLSSDIEKPGLVVGMGQTCLKNIHVVRDTDPCWETWPRFNPYQFLNRRQPPSNGAIKTMIHLL